MEDDEDKRREAAIASRPSLQPNFKPSHSGVTQAHLTKFQELHRRRLQIKTRPKFKNKAEGISDGTGKSRVKNLDAVDLIEDNSSKEIDDSGVVSILKGNTKDTSSLQQQTVVLQVGAKNRQKLHWGLDTKERWERKANM